MDVREAGFAIQFDEIDRLDWPPAHDWDVLSAFRSGVSVLVDGFRVLPPADLPVVELAEQLSWWRDNDGIIKYRPFDFLPVESPTSVFGFRPRAPDWEMFADIYEPIGPVAVGSGHLREGVDRYLADLEEALAKTWAFELWPFLLEFRRTRHHGWVEAVE
jgi:hypothetical protein